MVEQQGDVPEQDFRDCPKGPYTQQIQGLLPPLLTEELIVTHLQSSGKTIEEKQ